MNVPAVAKKTYDELRNQLGFSDIINFVLESLKRISNKAQRAEFIHKVVDEYNEEVFAHPLVKQFSPCKVGCSSCCHTQVSVTDDEAALLTKRINDGVVIDKKRLKLQATAKNDSTAFFKISFEDRKCVFLNDAGSCRIYADRPSVCRTNAVLGTPDQCDTRVSSQKTILIRTPKADMAIYASFESASDSGTLAYMLSKSLKL